jgi:undecaprenyl-phosphate 4-deoxy-4-formamido-L-arabinose transferase
MPTPRDRRTALPRGISVLVPVYNSETMLPELVRRLGPVLDSTGLAHELILVNDGSRDGSWDAIRHLAADHDWVRGIRLMRNHGQHNALLAGIRAARFDVTVTMDDDLQHPPDEIPRLLEAFTGDLDVVYGPPEREQHGFLRDIASVVTKLALHGAMGAGTARMVCAFRAFRTELRDAFASCQSPFVSIDILLTWGTSRFGSVRVRHEARRSGTSNYTFARLIRHALNMMTGFSILPLQMASIVGFAFTLFGICVLGYVLGRYLVAGSSVAGFPFLASIIAIFSGAQLFALGIIGEYLAHVHFRLMGKPPYVVGEETGGGRDRP